MLFEVPVIEWQHVRYVYVVEADDEQQAQAAALKSQTLSETCIRCEGVYNRELAGSPQATARAIGA